MPPRSTIARGWLLGGLSGALAVMLGAFGAHALRGSVEPALLETWRTAAHYHLLHSVVLIAIGAHPRGTGWATGLIATGIALFSGSLYLLVLTGQRWLGAVTPLGGVCLIAGWLTLAWFSRGRAIWKDQ